MALFETRGERAVPIVLGVLFGLCIALLVVSIVVLRRAGEAGGAGAAGRRTASQAAQEERTGAIVEATRRASPAVVSVTAVGTGDISSNPEYYFRYLQMYYFNPRQLEQLGGSPVLQKTAFGSGIVLSPDGYILTNEHVTRDAERIIVTMSDGTRAEATVVGSDAVYDIALLKIDAKNLPYAPLGDSDRLAIGEWVIAIGSPFGYLLGDPQPTVTVGVVSALHRDVNSSVDAPVFQNMIQTDAAISPGNSGGPLVSSAGEVIGINTFIMSTPEGSIPGMSFAIPINTAKAVVDEILQYGRVRFTYTGLTVSPVTPEVARRFGSSVTGGLLVETVSEDGPGAAAGIKRGDVILEVNGSKVSTAEQAAKAVFGLRVGDSVDMVIYRDGRTQTVKLRLVERRQGA